jgi:hypothetical protein
MYPRAAIIALAAVALLGGRAAAVPITTCGQVVPERAVELTGDLDCSGFAGDALVLARGGRLALNGFTLTAHQDHRAIECERSCRVVGPGAIRGGAFAIFAHGPPGRPTLLRPAILIVENVTVADAGPVYGNGWIYLRGTTIINSRASGVTGPRIVLRDATIMGSGTHGVGATAGGRIVLIDSKVVDNGTEPSRCIYPPECCDLAYYRSLRLAGASRCGTSCGTNRVRPGVCTND